MLDSFTLRTLSVAVTGVAAVVVWYFGYRTPEVDGTSAWSAGLSAYSLLFLLGLFRAQTPALVSIVLVSVLGVACLALLHLGACQILGVQFPAWIHLSALVFVAMALHLSFQDPDAGHGMRMLLMAGMTDLQSLLIARTFLRIEPSVPTEERRAYLLCGLSFGYIAFVQTIRAFTLSDLPPFRVPSVLFKDLVSQWAGASFLMLGLVLPCLVVYMSETRVRRRLRDTAGALHQRLVNLKTSNGLLPICAWCKSIRAETGNWQPVEVYLARHSGARPTHGICPNCARTHFPTVTD